jgi:hypothetical protein
MTAMSTTHRCRRIDCSNDELVERAIKSVLQEKFPQDGKKSLLVADEFHMLSKEHKEQLFYWVSQNLTWLKVVLIGNRSNGKPLTNRSALVLLTNCVFLALQNTTTN